MNSQKLSSALGLVELAEVLTESAYEQIPDDAHPDVFERMIEVNEAIDMLKQIIDTAIETINAYQ